MTIAIALQIFAAIGGLAGISTLINLLITRNKVTAEAADIEQNISDKILKNIYSDNEKLRQEREELTKEISKVRIEFNEIKVKMVQYELDQWETRMLVIKLIDWSKIAYEELAGHGSNIGVPPTIELLMKFKSDMK